MINEYTKPYDLAKLVLAAVEAEFVLALAADPTNKNIALPTVRFISNGDIPGDSELLAVALNRMYGLSMTAGLPNEELAAQRCLHWRAAQYEIALLRCAPPMEEHPYEGQPVVDYNLVDLSAQQVMRDSMIITRGILRAYRNGDFGEGPNLAFDEWTAIAAEGGLVGGTIKVRIGLV